MYNRFVCLCLVLLCLVTGCKGGAEFPKPDSRANARNVVLLVTFATRAAAGVCVQAMEAMEDAGDDKGAQELGLKCKDILLPVMVATRAAAKAVDTWNEDEGALGKVACLAKAFLGAVTDWATLVKAKGESVPSIVTDALPFVQTAVAFAPATCQ